MMKIILVLLVSAFSTAQAARLGLLRVDSYGPTKERPASVEFGFTRSLQKEDAFYAIRELMAMSMPMPMSMPMSMSMPSSSFDGTPTSAPASTLGPPAAPQVPTTAPTRAFTLSPTRAITLSPTREPTPSPTREPTSSRTPAPTSFPTGGVDPTLPAPTGSVDQGLSSANQAENSGGTSGPDTSQTIMFIVAAFAAVAVGAALMARKFATGSAGASATGSVLSAPSQEPAAGGHFVDMGL